MSFNFESFVALRYLKSKRKEVFISIITIISILGVAVSVMVLDIVLAVMTGFEAELRNKLVNANAHLVIRQNFGYLENASEIVEAARKVGGVVDAFPYTYNQAMLSAPGGARGLIIRGIADDTGARKKLHEVISDTVVVENLFKPSEIEVLRPDGEQDVVKLPPLVVGKTLMQQLAINEDNPVSLFSPEVSASPQGLIPKVRRFKIVGAYSSGLVEYEGGLAYAAIADAQAFFKLGASVTGVEVVVSDLMKAQEIGGKIIAALGGEKSGLYATDWTQPNKALWDALKLEKRVYFIVLLLLILVASFSIISTLVMVVMEKGKDIAILKTIGLSDRRVMKIFLMQGALIGFLGVMLGTVLGVAGCYALKEYGFEIDQSVFSLSEVPVHMIPANFILVAVSGFLITTLAGIYPALRAARLEPADALRFE